LPEKSDAGLLVVKPAYYFTEEYLFDEFCELFMGLENVKFSWKAFAVSFAVAGKG